jgi:phosphoribosylamine--glycine ligase
MWSTGDRVDVLVVGGGGREHALVWKLAQSKRVRKLYCAPGNAGIARHAECADISATDVDGLLRFAKDRHIDLTVVGPESPLIAGIADCFRKEGLAIFGPGASGAAIEGSKSFAKDLMSRFGVPTASYRVFDNPDAALQYIRQNPGPIVVKADGEAAGKGAIVCDDENQAADAVRAMMVERVFGRAGDRVVIEERMHGEEFSALAFADTRDGREDISSAFLMMPASQDHKPVFDGDRGPNTGGMGAYSPVPSVTPEIEQQVAERVFKRILKGLVDEGIEYRGVLYAGMMLTEDGIRVVEFNCRFGDPEAQAVLPRLDGDLLDPLEAVALDDGGGRPHLRDLRLRWRSDACVCVVMASGGYPGSYAKGKPITGLEDAERMPNVAVFHAGTAVGDDGRLVTSGGRVLGVTAWAPSIEQAVERAYAAVGRIKFEGAHYRRDIAHRAVGRK